MLPRRLGLYRVMAKIRKDKRLSCSEETLLFVKRKRIDLVYNKQLTVKGKKEIDYIVKTFPFLFSFDGFGFLERYGRKTK